MTIFHSYLKLPECGSNVLSLRHSSKTLSMNGASFSDGIGNFGKAPMVSVSHELVPSPKNIKCTVNPIFQTSTWGWQLPFSSDWGRVSRCFHRCHRFSPHLFRMLEPQKSDKPLDSSGDLSQEHFPGLESKSAAAQGGLLCLELEKA